MRIDWIPASAAALVVGAYGVVIAGQTFAQARGDGEYFNVLVQGEATVMAPMLLLGAGVLFIAGLPVVTTLLTRSARVGHAGLVLLLIGTVLLLGVTQQSVALVELADVPPERPSDIAVALLVLGRAAYGVGELLVAFALWRSGTTARWVPLCFVVHALFAVTARWLDLGPLTPVPIVAMAVGFTAVAVAVTGCSRSVGATSQGVAAESDAARVVV